MVVCSLFPHPHPQTVSSLRLETSPVLLVAMPRAQHNKPRAYFQPVCPLSEQRCCLHRRLDSGDAGGEVTTKVRMTEVTSWVTVAVAVGSDGGGLFNGEGPPLPLLGGVRYQHSKHPRGVGGKGCVCLVDPFSDAPSPSSPTLSKSHLGAKLSPKPTPTWK